MTILDTLRRRLKLRHALFFAFLCSGIIPLAISSTLLIRQNRDVLEGQERDQLVLAARVLAREVSDYLGGVEGQLDQLGMGLLAVSPGRAHDVLRARWVGSYLETFMMDHPDLLALRVLDARGQGPRLAPRDLPQVAQTAMDRAFAASSREPGKPGFRFVILPGAEEPAVVVAVPVKHGDDPPLVVEALARLHLVEAVFRREAQGEVAVFLIDREGSILWSEGASNEEKEALKSSDLMRDFSRRPLTLTTEYRVPAARGASGSGQSVLARVSAVERSGWGVVVQKPLAAAFAVVDKMVYNTVLSSILLVALALLFAVGAARRIGQPIQRLTRTSHEIAEGNFDRRVDLSGLSFELADLAVDFNRMGSQIESYVEQLRQAARANRELFIGLLRAMAAAIDAKDPYTRGHSERVAAVARVIARHLSLSPDLQEKVWIAAVLHDVGKIGVEDRILQKGGGLEPQEFEQMKLHTVIGAEIISRVEQLREMVPAIRWHHENWNGRGYPDGLKGEAIPLIARIIAVADTFDAITTNRPYQQAFTLEYSVETITRLAGSRFDAKVVTAFLRAFQMGQIQLGGRRPVKVEQGAAQPNLEALIFS